MRHLGKGYYIGALSAAGLHGAAHQQPQEFQVVTRLAARPVVAGRARIRFFGKRHFDRTPAMEMKTETGTMRVSTPEATALDLLRYAPSAGGLGNVATVLAELAERIDADRLAEVAMADGELVQAQRLGYLLDLVGARDRTEELAKLIEKAEPRSTALRPGQPMKGCSVEKRWRVVVNEQVEQDLILSRALVELYSDSVLQREVAFRGGTALHKLFLASPARYSEDIDLVQVEAGPIGAVMDAVHQRLDPWLGKPQWKQGRGRVTFCYRFMTEIEPVQQKRLKVEINSREHFSVLGLVRRRFEVASRWWSRQGEVTTYELDELLGKCCKWLAEGPRRSHAALLGVRRGAP